MKKLFPTAIAAFLAASCACVAAGAPQQASSAPVVQIQSGKVRGIERNGIMIFKGIPFAQPPVGDLRWAPPQPAKAWDGVRDATDFGHDCMQLPVPNDDTPLLTTPSEDCLYLNVWAPEHATEPLPVMVWIYGGGFVSGGTSPAVTSGANFAHDGIVFISFNYRLGRFGFFAFPALVERGGLVGNYAFMDQIAALKWVRRNIRAFGGNPFDVTIFGESAGGMSVNLLLTSPLARGLFNQAMIESGGGRANLLGPAPLDHPGPHGQRSAVEDGIAFAKSMGIEGTGAEALAALHALRAEKIVNGLSMASMREQRNTYSGPMVDGKIMVQPPEDVFRAGQEAKVPLVVGANTRDIGFARPETLDELFKQFGAREAEARKVFDPSGHEPAQQVGYKIAATKMMIEPARFVARSLARAGAPAYQYRFGYVASALRNTTPGAPHSSEVPYVFDTIRESLWSDFGKGITQQDLATARDMHAYWVNFVKTGDPNGPGLPSWSTITPDGNQLMNFTEDGPKGGTDPWKDRLDLVEPLQH
jgi:para-nitrobenzyl esterase